MTLKDILARLERIERMPLGWATCDECDEDVPIEDSDQDAMIAELKRDIEQFLIATTGTV